CKSPMGRGFPRARQRQGPDMGLSELCIRRPVLTTLVTTTFIVFGIFAYRLLPVAALAAVDFPTISVTATLPGASAENMAVAVAARNVSLDEIRRVLIATNSNSPVGTLYGQRQNITLLATNAMRHADEYKDVVVAWRNGAPVKLQEIATVVDSVENDKVASWYNDRRSVTLAVQRQPGANTVEVVDVLKERLPTYRAQVPPAVNLDVQFDR